MPRNHDDDDDFLDPFKQQQEEENQKKQRALDALEFFIGKFSPATKETADTFYNTTEISNAINELTGVRLSNSDVYEMMVNMSYKYEALSGLDFNWMLKKDCTP